MLLNREKIVTVKDSVSERVDVPEWGGHVFVRTLSGAERDTFEQDVLRLSKGNRSIDNVRARFLILCLCDDKGATMFDRADIAILGSKSAKVLDSLFEVAQRLNGMGADDVEELAKV